jgi:mannose-1-phosphate guanylyltransferase/mannose-6-phosphate isomerase
MKSIILAGGSGTRLWPVSRSEYPKQFMKINGDKSLLFRTIERLQRICGLPDIYVITNDRYKYHVSEELSSFSKKMSSNMILEPVGRNTAPAIALAIKYCTEVLGCSEEEVIFISPSDHIIKPANKFAELIKKAEKTAKDGYIVTFGIEPDSPETGYGYIKRGKRLNGSERAKHGPYYIERFIEKPNIRSARKYVSDNKYLWNSGMFAFRADVMIEELEKYDNDIYKIFNKSYDYMIKHFNKMPNISIDYSVMEKSKKTAVIPAKITWSDVGSWDSLLNVLGSDKNNNVTRGDVINVDSENIMVLSESHLISTIGLRDILVVETNDAILISKRGESQKVKDVVSILKKKKRKEIDEHLTVYRPWGNYSTLEEGPRYKIKRIVVKPRARLSHQMHYHRSEHWIVIKGTAKVTIGDKEELIHENESTYVPKSTPHRLENPGKLEMELIEVQNGEYVEEDDIIRFEDIYGRAEG